MYQILQGLAFIHKHGRWFAVLCFGIAVKCCHQVEDVGSISVFCNWLSEKIEELRGWQRILEYVIFCSLISEFPSLFIMSVCSYSLGFNIKLVSYRSKSYSWSLTGVLIRNLLLEFIEASHMMFNLLTNTALLWLFIFLMYLNFSLFRRVQSGLTRSMQSRKIKYT